MWARFTQVEFYAQDSWRVNRKLSLELGLRYNIIGPIYSALGNFAIFFEVSAASYLDGSRARVRLLPLIMLGFLVGLFAISHETLLQILLPRQPGARVRWRKTEHPHTIHDRDAE